MQDEIPSVDDILDMVSGVSYRKGKVDKWMEENPDQGEVFVEAVKRALSRGLPLTHVVSKCQEVLGGPPGSITTIRLALRRYVQEEERD